MLAQKISADLGDLETHRLLRRPRVVEGVRGPFVRIEGREVLCFCSNDYLGLAQDPRLAEAAARAAREYGWGTSSSRLLSGTTRWHVELERALAEFQGTEAALCFPSGYMANLGVLTALTDEETLVVSDELNHASMIDACRLSRARVVKYPHRDVAAARDALQADARTKIIVTDSIFSMDGDRAPLRELAALGADLLVDDAHGFGVFGAGGRGVLEDLALDLPIHMATLSKAAGCSGGFVAGPRDAIELIRSRARSFIFTTAWPPAVCAAATESVRLLREGSGLRRKLRDNVARFTAALRARGFDLRESAAPIVPIVLGSNERALAASERLWKEGFFAPAIRPPTVPEGQERLRISITAMHEPEHLEALVAALEKI